MTSTSFLNLRRRVVLLLSAAAVAGVVAVASLGAAVADTQKPEKPQTKVTQTISQANYKQMEVAQKALDAKDYKGAAGKPAPRTLP